MSNQVQTSTSLGLSGLLNMCGLLGICLTLSIAFYYQLAQLEIPCPLCLLQRVGLIIAGMGFLFNVRLGIKNTHYAMVLVGCVVTGIIAARQVLLHILPGDTGYGSDFLGLHFYTWALLTAVLTVIAVALMLMVDEQERISLALFPNWNKAISLLFVILIAGNLISTVLECGAGQCADNPISYQLLAK